MRIYFICQIGYLQLSSFKSSILRCVLGVQVFCDQSTRILKFSHCVDRIHYTPVFINTTVTLILIGSATVCALLSLSLLLLLRIFELKIYSLGGK
jgi:hypothetical protein